MNLTEAKELLKAELLTEADLDALLAAERERCCKTLDNLSNEIGRMIAPTLGEYKRAIRRA